MTKMWRWSLWGSAAALVVPFGIGLWLLFAPEMAAGRVTDRSVGAEITAPTSARSLDSLVAAARRTAPFRPDGRPSRVTYDPARREASPDYAPPKPVLTLSGLVEGGAPLAIVEGIPGRDGPALLGVGDTLAGLKVRRIREGNVTITGMDTTWVLTIRRLP